MMVQEYSLAGLGVQDADGRCECHSRLLGFADCSRGLGIMTTNTTLILRMTPPVILLHHSPWS